MSWSISQKAAARHDRGVLLKCTFLEGWAKTPIIDIYDGCLDEGIRIIDVRHEQAAAHAADAWTRVTGKPGVAVVTAGPGTTEMRHVGRCRPRIPTCL